MGEEREKQRRKEGKRRLEGTRNSSNSAGVVVNPLPTHSIPVIVMERKDQITKIVRKRYVTGVDTEMQELSWIHNHKVSPSPKERTSQWWSPSTPSWLSKARRSLPPQP